MTRHTNASAPADEAAVLIVPTSESGTAKTLPAGSFRTFWTSLAQRLTAAGRWASSRRDAFASWCNRVLGPVEFSASVHRRGYVTEVCAVCRVDVHDIGEMCSKQWVAICSVCGLTLLDYFGKCLHPRSEQRTHVISNSTRRAATLQDWRRLRFSIVKRDP
jgi:hypothetical protein